MDKNSLNKKSTSSVKVTIQQNFGPNSAKTTHRLNPFRFFK
jgi:hypothetical protein